MSKGLCESCAWWDEWIDAQDEPIGHGNCTWFDAHRWEQVPDIPADLGSDPGMLRTRADFGCVLWEQA